MILTGGNGTMSSREVIVNLWYVIDDQGLIYSLRAKAYVVTGSDEEKLKFLQQRASLDYLIAEPFEIPKRFHIRIGTGPGSEIMPIAHSTSLEVMDSPIALFEDALKIIEGRFPSQSQIDIPHEPLVCTTPLMQNRHKVIEPNFSKQTRFNDSR